MSKRHKKAQQAACGQRGQWPAMGVFPLVCQERFRGSRRARPYNWLRDDDYSGVVNLLYATGRGPDSDTYGVCVPQTVAFAH